MTHSKTLFWTVAAVLASTLALGCDDGGSAGIDSGTPPTADAAPGTPDTSTTTDAGGPRGEKPTGAACTNDHECLGGTCFGRAGGHEDGNIRFAGGYCTSITCTVNSQDGCGPDEWCIEGGAGGAYCVELCSKADGMTCDREDHVCLGLGTWGGCFHQNAVECDSDAHTGCGEGQLCVRIGFEDSALGRCETLCDPMLGNCESATEACYYIKRYNTAFCGSAGTTLPEELCACDKCCTEDYACTPDLDGAGRHCKAYCVVADGCTGGTCVALEPGSPWGGCVPPGSSGT